MDWRVLVVDDREAEDISEFIEGNKTVAQPDSITCVLCSNFSQATDLLKNGRFDLVVLDLKDDSAPEGDILAGETVFDSLKELHFVPVVFHTGYANKVDHLASPFVKVVRRSEWEHLRSAIKEVLATDLPRLVRHIEEEQRRFMWESAERIWTIDLDRKNSTDLAYLLARRLSNVLSGDAVRSFLEASSEQVPQVDTVHAIELYVYPPVSSNLLFGDIFKKCVNGRDEFFVALTPSCDHAQKKAAYVLLAKCELFVETQFGEKAKKALETGEQTSNNLDRKLLDYIRDNSKPEGRFKYLPRTSFLPDLLVDLQCVMTVAPDALDVDSAAYEDYHRIASLDSPFAESLQTRMTRYLGRVGTPDIDSDLALSRFKSMIEKKR